VRIGVGKPGRVPGTATGGADVRAGGGDTNVAGWVLSDFPGPQLEIVNGMLARAVAASEMVVGLGVTPAMNEFNGKPAVI
jgi:peptidyl-tRNA hydrolase